MSSTVLSPTRQRSVAVNQYATFYVGHMLLGIDIAVVQEINRHGGFTRVPHAPQYVRGVINLRGEVATIIDLRTILGLPKTEEGRDSRNLIVHYQGESIGLVVDKISDILTIGEDDVTPPPANVGGVDGRLMKGVCTLDTAIVMLLDIDQVLSDSTRQD
jgi:purine-binding chemotaxis protein CheW